MFETKLTAAQKNEIFDRAIFDGESDASLAAAYGVSRKTIWRLMEKDVPENMLYINQNAAVDILNRAGVKRKDEESTDINVTLTGGFESAMPEGDD